MKSKKSGSSQPSSLFSTHDSSKASKPQPFLPDLMTPWEEFYRRQSRFLSRIAVKVGVPPDQIADVVQEAWLAAIEHHQEFRGEDAEKHLASWLAGVVRKKSIDTIRRLGRRRIESLGSLPAEPADGKAKQPAALMESKERDESVAAKLEELRKKNSLNYRLVREHILEGRSLPDVATQTGLGIHAISCRIGRALKEFRGQLQE